MDSDGVLVDDTVSGVWFVTIDVDCCTFLGFDFRRRDLKRYRLLGFSIGAGVVTVGFNTMFLSSLRDALLSTSAGDGADEMLEQWDGDGSFSGCVRSSSSSSV
jgi:hypothetical protein